MDADHLTGELTGIANEWLSWPDFVAAADGVLVKAIGFDRSCWHTVDPGTVLMTGSVNRDVVCSGSWLAEHEYVLEDVNKWDFLARSGRLAGATSQATHGDLNRSARHRSHMSLGIVDELRVSAVDSEGYWAAIGLLREERRPWFSEHDERLLASLSPILAAGARRGLVSEVMAATDDSASDDRSVGPGVVTFDAAGRVESMTAAARHWIDLIIESPPPDTPAESKVLQGVAVRARLPVGSDPLHASARARVRAADGAWLLLYGSALSGADGRTVVVIQPAAPAEVAPLIAFAYGLTPREVEVTGLCIHGLTTKQIATRLHLSAYTVQDHFKAIFEKTGVRSRGELVGHVFLEHYVPRWEQLADPPNGWLAYASRK